MVSLFCSGALRRLFTILFTFGTAGLCFSVAEAKSPLALDVLRRDGYGVVPISQPRPNTLVVSAVIDGRKLNLVLDTGYGVEGIALDSSAGLNSPAGSASHTIETASGKRLDVRKGMAQSVIMGNVHIQGVPLLLGTFNGFYEEQKDKFVTESRIDAATRLGASGFLGRGFLKMNHAIIDLQNLRLYLRPPGTGRRVQLGPALKAVGMAEASFSQMASGTYLVDIELNGVPGKMFMDTGATLTGLDPRFAAQAKASGYGRRNLEALDAAGVHSSMDLAGSHSFKIGGIPVGAPTLTTSIFPFYTASGGKIVGLLGVDVLGQNWGIIDFGEEKLYFAKGK
jgi:predicted aspartyl protease